MIYLPLIVVPMQTLLRYVFNLISCIDVRSDLVFEIDLSAPFDGWILIVVLMLQVFNRTVHAVVRQAVMLAFSVRMIVDQRRHCPVLAVAYVICSIIIIFIVEHRFGVHVIYVMIIHHYSVGLRFYWINDRLC